MTAGMTTVAVIGLGRIGLVVGKRLLAADYSVRGSDSSAEARERALRAGIDVLPTAQEVASGANMILLALPPAAVTPVLSEIQGSLQAEQVIVSLAGAVPLDYIQELAGPTAQVARIMPNTPSLVGQGMNPVCYGKHLSASGREQVRNLLVVLGETTQVADEQMNLCTGLTGAAPRYIFAVIEALAEAAVAGGLSQEEGIRMATQVTAGSALAVLQSGLTLDELKALTPLQPLDEEASKPLFRQAVETAEKKMDAVWAGMTR
ncbi:MAG: NAD(P)-binding domain-containing protein [Chloroflexi bacterium]|nr:NAD(P)-binding domain-containing protein [Chloroflexota bacterium]